MLSEDVLLSQFVDSVVLQDGPPPNWKLESGSERYRKRWVLPRADRQLGIVVGWQIVDRYVSIERIDLGGYLVEVLLVVGTPMNDDEISFRHG